MDPTIHTKLNESAVCANHQLKQKVFPCYGVAYCQIMLFPLGAYSGRGGYSTLGVSQSVAVQKVKVFQVQKLVTLLFTLYKI